MNERIKKLRRALGLTQQEFADKIGMKRNTVANYETNRNEPSNSVISLICREFNVSEKWLRTGDGEMFFQMPKSEALEQQLREFIKDGSDTFRERLISLLLRLPPEHWEMLQHYAQELIDSRPPQPTVPAVAPTPPSAGRVSEPVAELKKELAELKRQNQEIIRQNQEMAAKIVALEEEDARREADQGEFTETEEKLSTFAEEKKMLA